MLPFNLVITVNKHLLFNAAQVQDPHHENHLYLYHAKHRSTTLFAISLRSALPPFAHPCRSFCFLISHLRLLHSPCSARCALLVWESSAETTKDAFLSSRVLMLSGFIFYQWHNNKGEPSIRGNSAWAYIFFSCTEYQSVLRVSDICLTHLNVSWFKLFLPYVVHCVT